ncbi:MAG: ABC transporter ATP-binding protein [Nitrososphaerales archaeon]
MPQLEIKKLEVFYGDLQVLWGVSLFVEKGELVSVIGANGAGKTTLMKSIVGIVKPKRGTILFDGKRIDGTPPHKIIADGIVYVPEGRRIFPRLSVIENLRMGAYTRRARAQVNESLKYVFNHFPILKERRNQAAGTLSGGEQQMLAIARSLMAMPKLLLLDEPSMGLSPIMVTKIFDTIKNINKEGTTIILVEQDVLRALKLSDRCYVMETGRVIIEGEGSELEKNDYVKAAYLGL